MKRKTTLSNSIRTENIRLSVAALTIMVLNASVSFGLDLLGPPTASLEPGQPQLGIEYSQSKMDIELKNGSWIESINGLFTGSGIANALTLKDFKSTNTYLNLGYGIDYNWEIFVRLSSTKAEFGDSLWQIGEEFDSASAPMYGGGIKAIFIEEDNLKIGGIVQANWSHYNGILNTPLWVSPHFIEADFREIQITLGATYMAYQNIWIYGGPLMHILDGEFSETYVEDAETGGFLLAEWQYDIEQDSMYGGYIGSTLEIDEFNSLNLEYQFTGSASAFGASYMLKF